eukprot:365907-Chlamydomonas_euryale.AAC.24
MEANSEGRFRPPLGVGAWRTHAYSCMCGGVAHMRSVKRNATHQQASERRLAPHTRGKCANQVKGLGGHVEDRVVRGGRAAVRSRVQVAMLCKAGQAGRRQGRGKGSGYSAYGVLACLSTNLPGVRGPTMEGIKASGTGTGDVVGRQGQGRASQGMQWHRSKSVESVKSVKSVESVETVESIQSIATVESVESG